MRRLWPGLQYSVHGMERLWQPPNMAAKSGPSQSGRGAGGIGTHTGGAAACDCSSGQLVHAVFGLAVCFGFDVNVDFFCVTPFHSPTYPVVLCRTFSIVATLVRALTLRRLVQQSAWKHCFRVEDVVSSALC